MGFHFFIFLSGQSKIDLLNLLLNKEVAIRYGLLVVTIT